MLLKLFLLVLVLQCTTHSANSSTSVIKLRVGVPKKDGFTQFVDVRWDPQKQKYNVSGYCIDVFNAVLKLLPFNVSAEFEPYVDASGQSAGTYDSLLQQIPAKKYDAVVGDVTIVANRSKYVDFTLPFTESGVSMVVKVEHGSHLTMWAFVKPFSWDLWLSIFIACIFIGSVILIMERNNAISTSTCTNNTTLPTHPENVNNASPNHHKKKLNVVTVLWFPISQAVLPDREVVAKNCSRFVLMVWLLLTFVLMQSYTASLTSMLTLDQLQPSFLSVNDLRNGGYYVGYQDGSFVYDLLIQRLKFDPSKLRPYNTVAEYHNALQKGSNGGGVAAIFDELPYLRIFLSKFGSDYMLAGSTYRTDGFGFAFPLNSNLTIYFSREILNVTESDTIDEIEKKYLGENSVGLDQSGQIQSSSSSSSSSSSNTAILTSHSFAGLFLITGVATILALIVSESVIWEKPILMARAYSEKYLFTPARSRENSVHPCPHDHHSSNTDNDDANSPSTSADASVQDLEHNIDIV